MLGNSKNLEMHITTTFFKFFCVIIILKDKIKIPGNVNSAKLPDEIKNDMTKE